jgi:hypothetical protein
MRLYHIGSASRKCTWPPSEVAVDRFWAGMRSVCRNHSIEAAMGCTDMAQLLGLSAMPSSSMSDAAPSVGGIFIF